MLELLLLTCLGAVSALLLVLARAKFAPATDGLITLINDRLPQTQCAQCGYPGCRPYAEAVLAGEAINRCPPGGTETIDALAELLGRPPLPPESGTAASPRVAVIREDDCIGCALCIAACPVDAIIGATGRMHTVVASLCTGCDLCREPCPVDCIDLLALPPAPAAPPFPPAPWPCINCGACAVACPRALQPQRLYRHREDHEKAADQRLADCIECGLCDATCPSQLPLTATFRVAKANRRRAEDSRRQAEAAQARFLARQARLRAAADSLVKRPGAAERRQLLGALEDNP